MIRNILCMILLAAAPPAFSVLTLRTERNSVCGVELYEERYDGDVCGWVFYEKQTSACDLDYYVSGPDMSCQGSVHGGRKVGGEILTAGSGSDKWRIPYDLWVARHNIQSMQDLIQGPDDLRKSLGYEITIGGQGSATIETAHWSCKATKALAGSSWYGGITCIAKPYAASCPLEKFGKVYKFCRAEAHGRESPKKCRSDKFNAELYNSCSFYKTAEEIDAFIDATYSSLATNSVILPAKQADLYTSFRQEASFICLIEKYKDLEGFDVVYDDLTKKFLDAFAYDYTESTLTCADAAIENRDWKITAGAFDCKNFDVNTIRNLKQPEGMNTAVFNRFKSTCSTKLTYDFIVGWFDDKAAEVGQLLGDLVARTDAARKAQLEDLKKSVIESK